MSLFLRTLEEMYPNAQCELSHRNPFELLVAVILSAQTTDESVNRVTPKLFSRYDNSEKLANSSLSDLEEILRSIGLYRRKALNIRNAAITLNEQFDGKVPSTMNKLLNIPGVGRKTANVILAVAFDIPSMPVDTHVMRVSTRLGYASMNDGPKEIEIKLKEIFPEEIWNKLHHQIIFFGRYHCLARKPNCDVCKLSNVCPYLLHK